MLLRENPALQKTTSRNTHEQAGTGGAGQRGVNLARLPASLAALTVLATCALAHAQTALPAALRLPVSLLLILVTGERGGWRW